jgi:hypothetical protein
VKGLELLIEELSAQSQMIHSATNEAVAFCKQFILISGNSDQNPSDICLKFVSELLVEDTSKVRIVFQFYRILSKGFKGFHLTIGLDVNTAFSNVGRVQIVDKVISRMHTFGITASKAVEFLHNDNFPSKISLLYAVTSIGAFRFRSLG